jgi:hypothetical protein
LENKEKVLIARKEYWDKVKDLPNVRERCKRTAKVYFENNPERFILNRCKTRAKRSGLPFDLDISDILIPEVCPVLKIPIIRGKGVPNDQSPSIDRIDPAGGYVRGNTQIISNLANMMKSSASPEMLMEFARWVNENYSPQATSSEQ